MRKWRQNVKMKKYKQTLKVMMSSRSIIPSSCQWAGMGSLYLTGCMSFMDLARKVQADTGSDDGSRSIIPSSCQWAGMGSLYLTGCISFMDSGSLKQWALIGL